MFTWQEEQRSRDRAARHGWAETGRPAPAVIAKAARRWAPGDRMNGPAISCRGGGRSGAPRDPGRARRRAIIGGPIADPFRDRGDRLRLERRLVEGHAASEDRGRTLKLQNDVGPRR